MRTRLPLLAGLALVGFFATHLVAAASPASSLSPTPSILPSVRARWAAQSRWAGAVATPL